MLLLAPELRLPLLVERRDPLAHVGILNGALRCPLCGGETMRVKRPWGLKWFLDLMRLRYRLCRHCMRTWIAAR